MVKGFNRSFIMVCVTMLVVCMTCSSCETLRKKFTRQKKADKKAELEFQPVLEPQEYIAKDKDPGEMYKQHYALLKTWYKDLWVGVNERGSDASVKYSIKQIVDNIDKMKAYLPADKARGLNRLVLLLEFYEISLHEPRQTRNYSRIQSDLRAFDRMLRDEYRYDAVKDILIRS